LAGLVILSATQTVHQRPGTDFHARWMAGRWFSQGQSLYQYLPGEREPSYPPFAAMMFQVFGWFPLHAAAAVFYFINLLLIPAAVVLTHRIHSRLWPRPIRWRWPLVLAFVFSAQFLLNNLNLDQVNTLLFVMCLWGMEAYLAGENLTPAAAFVFAAFIKVIPGVFVGWLVLRGRPRAVLAAAGFSLACLVAPLAQRGVAGGLQDWRAYYQTFLGGFQGGVPDEYDRYTNQALGPAVHRLFRPPVAAGEWDYRIVDASEASTLVIYRGAALAIALGLLAFLLRLRAARAPVTVWEWSALFLAGHLLSGITWKAHLVTLLFVYCGFVAPPDPATRPRRVFRWTAIGLMAVTGLLGRDVVGNTIHHWLGGFSVLTWLMVLLLAGCIAFAWPRAPRVEALPG
jgi:hypothetical protein